jgi:hypothetical protein
MTAPDDRLATEINAAHAEFVNSQKGTISAAFKAGDLLNQAKTAVKASGGKWREWLSEYCRELPQTTASLYMRLAENQALIRSKQRVASAEALASEGRLTIRGALKLLPKKPRAAKAAAAKSAVTKAAARDATHDLLKSLDADELFTLLRAAWEPERVETLAKLLESYLKPAPTQRAQVEARIES